MADESDFYIFVNFRVTDVPLSCHLLGANLFEVLFL